jgi:hypothetical protein
MMPYQDDAQVWVNGEDVLSIFRLDCLTLKEGKQS